MLDLFDIEEPNGEDNDPGLKGTIFIAPERAFVLGSGIKGVKKTKGPGDSVTIDGTHEFKVGEGFISMYSTLDSSEDKLEPSGERDGRGQTGTLEFFSPGSKKALAEFARRVKNMSCILIVEYPDGQRMQIGQRGLGCEIVGSYTSGKLSGGRKGWTFTVSYYANSLLYYEGSIKLKNGAVLDPSPAAEAPVEAGA